MTVPQREPVEREIRILARPETIFPFFTDPAKMVRWKGTEAALDPRPGGIYRVNVTGQNIARGEYREIVPYSRIVFTWGWEGDAAVPPGSTTIEGWEHYLPRLAAAASGGDAGPDPWVVRSGHQL